MSKTIRPAWQKAKIFIYGLYGVFVAIAGILGLTYNYRVGAAYFVSCTIVFVYLISRIHIATKNMPIVEESADSTIRRKVLIELLGNPLGFVICIFSAAFTAIAIVVYI